MGQLLNTLNFFQDPFGLFHNLHADGGNADFGA